MTTTIHIPTDSQISPSRSGAIGALIAAAAFVFGIVLFVTTLSDYTEGDPTPGESVEFLVGHQTTLFAWYLVIFLVFGVAIIPLARTLRERLADVSPQLADVGAVFAYIWAGLMFATGMIHNIGITAVADMDETDPAAAQALWSSIDTVTEGLGGGNELVGGLWILVVSLAAWGTGRLPTGLNVLGLVSAVVGMIFGLGSIAWFAWTGIVLLRSPEIIAPAAEFAR